MNLKFWDRYKAIAVITAVMFLFSFGLGIMSSNMEDKASEEAAYMLSEVEAESVLRFYSLYNQRLPVLYGILNSFQTILSFLILGGVLYTAWSALGIPDRYQKKVVMITTPEQLLEEAITFFKEFYEDESYWQPLVEAQQKFKTGNKQQALLELNEALSHMDTLRSKKAKIIKEKLVSLAEELKES